MEKGLPTLSINIIDLVYYYFVFTYGFITGS